ncbi:MAG: hypothetical protein PVF13_02150, partial [Chromatiales bacterium]
MHPIGSKLQRSWLARIAMPWLSVLVGMVCGMLTWLLLDPILNQRLEQIFRNNLLQRLELSSTDTRHRFEGFLNEWRIVGHSLAQHWGVVDYLNSRAWEETLETPRHYSRRQLPGWLEPGHLGFSSIEPDQIALLDSDGGAREIYQAKSLPFELERLTDYFNGREDVAITTVQQR